MKQTPDFATTLNQNFADLSEWVKTAADSTGAFIAREAPLFVQEFIRWTIVKGVAAAAAFLIAFVGLFLVCRWMYANHREATTVPKKDYGNYDGGWLGAMAGTGVIGVISMIIVLFPAGVLSTAGDAVKAYVAPRVLLVEKTASSTSTGTVTGVMISNGAGR